MRKDYRSGIGNVLLDGDDNWHAIDGDGNVYLRHDLPYVTDSNVVLPPQPVYEIPRGPLHPSEVRSATNRNDHRFEAQPDWR